MSVPDIVSGTVTRRSNSQHQWSTSLKAMTIGCFFVTVIVALGLIFAPAKPLTLPQCKGDDGQPPKGSASCVWDAHRQGNGAGDSFINLNGKIYIEGGTR